MNDIASAIPYVPPKDTLAAYTGRVLGILKEAEQLDPRLLWHMLAPSNVLALAGLRGYSPYNDALDSHIDARQFDKFLADRGFAWVNENPQLENPPLPSYGLANFTALDHLQKTYPLEVIEATGKCPERSIWGFYAWLGALDIAFARAMESGVLPKEWLKDWWSPHNVRFGMILGYPAPAIATFVQSEVDESFQKEIEEVEIEKGLFDSARVSFAISKKARSREDVTTAIGVWKGVLEEVYAVYRPEDIKKFHAADSE